MSAFALKRILCAVDLSPASWAVLRWAGMFAKAWQAPVEVLYVDSQEWPPYFLPSQAEDFYAQAQRQREALREDLARIARKTLDLTAPSEVVILEGRPVETILKYAAARHSGLVVMGSHGRSGITRMRLGSVADNVIRGAIRPTLVLGTHARQQESPKISRVLCPVNFTGHGLRSLEQAAEVAATFGAELAVLHSIEQSYTDLEQIREQLCRWVPEAARRHCYVTESVRQGNPAEQILLAAREQAVDLIVLAAQHRPLLEFTTLGTTTERVMRHADSAVLVLPHVNEVAP